MKVACHRLFFSLPVMLVASSASAHVQWFITPNEMKCVTVPIDVFTVLTSVFVFLLSFVAFYVSQRKVLPTGLDDVIRNDFTLKKELLSNTLSFFTIVFFLLLVGKGGFIAPNLMLPVKYDGLGWFLQAIVVVTLAFNHVVGGIAILATVFLMLTTIPLDVSVNYMFEFISMGVFFILTGCAALENGEKRQLKWGKAVTILRVGFGLQLSVLALTEKLVYPGLAVAFIEMFPFYNFFTAIGLETFSDVHFVYFIGVSELSLGIMLTLGLANRIVIVALAFAFTATAVIHGMHEVEGHLPFFGAIIVLFIECKNKERYSVGLRARDAPLA